MQKIAALRDAHRRIEQQIALLVRVVSAEVPDAASVAMMRWELAKALSDHRIRADREICVRVLGSSDVLAVRAAWRHRQIAGTTQALFLRFVAAWPVERVAADWRGFGAAAAEVLEALAEQIAWEERELFAHAGRVLSRHAA